MFYQERNTSAVQELSGTAVQQRVIPCRCRTTTRRTGRPNNIKVRTEGTVGLDEQMIRAYVRNQDELDRQESLDFDE